MEKEKMKLSKKIFITVGVIITILLIITIRKFCILLNLEKTAKDIGESSNYYARQYSINTDEITITESYNKDSNYLTKINIYKKSFQETSSLILYKNENEYVGAIQSGEKKIAVLDHELVGGNVSVNSISTRITGVVPKIIWSITSKITTDECNDKECYLIEDIYGRKIWVDKKTALIVREIENNGIVTDYNFEINSVIDNDIKKPDISEYEIQETRKH